MQYIVSLEALEKISCKICTENLWTSVKIFADLQLALHSSSTIFTDPQGKNDHKSVQILKKSSTWNSKRISLYGHLTPGDNFIKAQSKGFFNDLQGTTGSKNDFEKVVWMFLWKRSYKENDLQCIITNSCFK